MKRSVIVIDCLTPEILFTLWLSTLSAVDLNQTFVSTPHRRSTTVSKQTNHLINLKKCLDIYNRVLQRKSHTFVNTELKWNLNAFFCSAPFAYPLPHPQGLETSVPCGTKRKSTSETRH